VEFEYPDGSRLFSFCRHIHGCWNSVSEHVIGTKGTCDVGNHVIRGANQWRLKRDGIRDAYQQEHDELFDAIRNNKPRNDTEYGAYSTMTAILGRMCTYSGKMIEWDEALNSEKVLMPDKLDFDAMPKSLPDENGLYKLAIPGQTITV